VAGVPRLTRLVPRHWLGLVLFVLLLHLFAIDWVGSELQQSSLLPKMVTPMFTRLLQQQAPAQVVASAAPAACAAPPRPQVRTIAPRPSPSPARAASQPEAPASAPQAEAATAGASAVAAAVATAAPASASSASSAAASRPQAVASAPQPGASQAAAMAAAAAASAPMTPSGPGLAADGWPVDTRVNYRLGGNYRGALHGSARVQWLRQGWRYETRIDIDITLLASLSITSQGAVTPAGLKPDVYEEARRNGVRRADLGEDTIRLGNGKIVPRPPGVQDAASQFVELAHRFASGQDRLEVGRSVTLWLARPGGVDRWTYDVVGRDTLQTPELGAIDTFHLKPRPIDQPRGNITAEIWFAPSLQYLPVRIRLDMDGQDTYLDLVVLNIQQHEAKASPTARP
jgi:hypothetical protein